MVVGSQDEGWDITVDDSSNVYVVGKSKEGTNNNYATIKYNTNGDQIWVRRFNMGSETIPKIIYSNNNIYVSGSRTLSSIDYDFLLIKYNRSGDQLWYETYNGPVGGVDFGNDLNIDNYGNIYITGISDGIGTQDDFATVKFNNEGTQQWVIRYDGSSNSNEGGKTLTIDNQGNVIVVGDGRVGTYNDMITIKYSQSGITNPAPYDKWIAGETDTIRWTDRGWTFVNIKCMLNYETSDSSEHIIENFYFADSSKYVWNIPDTLLSFRSKIIIENANNPEEKIESEIFRIKPYVLTRVTPDSIYYDYQKARDQWSYENTEEDMWPPQWYQQQFYYRGTDPFTGLQYSQWQGDSAFARANHKDHVDWISWVNAFNVDFCYLAINPGLYSFSAITKWEAIKGKWVGSCFGIAAANALAFNHREEFQNKYPNYPAFINPISVVSDTGVKRVVNELFSHQYGNPSIANDNAKYNIITPNGTLNELKEMLKEDNAEVKTLTIYNNSPGGGGHTILGYGLKRDKVQDHIYHIQVYDNSNPFTNNPITIDTTLNGGNGAWETPDWPGWGGNKNIYLEIIDDNYLNNASFPDRLNSQSPFVLSKNELEINNSRDLSIQIIDTQGNVTGYANDIVLNEIPGSLPMILKNGSETPPYGYHLSTNDYSVILNGFTEDTVKAFFFTGNKSFSYSRSGAEQKQTDRLFFDGGVSAVNPDAQVKTVKLLNIINETTQEKLFAIRSLQLVQNDSVKIENPNENNLKLISYGSQKNYDIEINYVSQNEIGRFGNFNISLSANTSHTFVPDWQNINNSMLVILVDNGNNGKIDDTLYINNTVDIEDQGNLLVPDKYDLAQNYPNPFNPTTTIQYSILHTGFVSIKIYDVLGREVVSLVNEEKLPGVYEVKFDGSRLPSGLYFYRLETEEFLDTKKMVLIK